jgi:hypothetical protein
MFLLNIYGVNRLSKGKKAMANSTDSNDAPSDASTDAGNAEQAYQPITYDFAESDGLVMNASDDEGFTFSRGLVVPVSANANKQVNTYNYDLQFLKANLSNH